MRNDLNLWIPAERRADVMAVPEVDDDQHTAAGITLRDLQHLLHEVLGVCFPGPNRVSPGEPRHEAVEEIGNVVPRAFVEGSGARSGALQVGKEAAEQPDPLSPPA